MLPKRQSDNRVQHAHTSVAAFRIQKTMDVHGMTQKPTRIIAAGKTHVFSMQRVSVAVVVEVIVHKSSIRNLQNRRSLSQSLLGRPKPAQTQAMEPWIDITMAALGMEKTKPFADHLTQNYSNQKRCVVHVVVVPEKRQSPFAMRPTTDLLTRVKVIVNGT